MADSIGDKDGRDLAAASETRLTRRLMLGILVATGAAGTAVAQTIGKVVTAPKTGPLSDKLVTEVTRPGAANKLFSLQLDDETDFELMRPEDMALLRFSLRNLVATGQGSDRKIKRINAGKPGLLLAIFQPQAIAETVFPDVAPKEPQPFTQADRSGNAIPAKPLPPPKTGQGKAADARLSHETRLTFVMPDGVNAIDYSTKAVLDACRTWSLKLDSRAIDAPMAQAEAHDFDRTRSRMAAIVKAQATTLRGYKDGKASVEALLERAADAVADALTRIALDGTIPGDAEIDALIDTIVKAEILASAGPAAPAAPSGKLQGVKTTVQVPANYKAFVNAQATAKLIAAAEASQKNATIGGKFVPIWPDFTPRFPERDCTDIEAPYRMHMTPLATAGFTHASGYVTHGTAFAELWHTRMGTRVGEWVLDHQPEPMRALFANDMLSGQSGKPTLDPDLMLPGDWALLGSDRLGLVSLTSSQPTSRPVMAQHMRLSALGASFDYEGTWDNPLDYGTDILAWKHIASVGRDQYVRVIYDGYLYPFGHSAALIKVSERKFSRQPDGGRVAALMQKHFIVVRQKVCDYPAWNQANQGRDLPFVAVEISARQTPDLDKPMPIAELGAGFYSPVDASYQTFWPQRIEGGDMIFPLVGIDSAGNRTPFNMPLLFVAGTRNVMPSGTAPSVANVVTYYNSPGTLLKRMVNLPRPVVRFCDAARDAGQQDKPSETDYPVKSIVFRTVLATAAGDDANAFPALETAHIEIPSYRHLVGKTVDGTVGFHDDYVKSGFHPTLNRGEIVLKLTAKPAFDIGTTDRFGGLMKPDLSPQGLSRLYGGVSDILAFSGETFDPLAALKGTNLLGAIPLDKVFGAIPLSDYASIPKAISADIGTAISTTYTIQRDGLADLKPLFISRAEEITETGDDGKPVPQLKIVSQIITPKFIGAAPTATVNARLLKFTINLFGFVALNFDELTLKVQPGHKTDVNPTLDKKNGVVFGGPLEFINSLRDIIPMDGFSDPPGLDVTPNGITASYSMGLPAIGVGAMTLQNVSIGARFDLPFTGGGPSARFNFAELHNPFNLTIGLFGGGGFCALEVGSKGVVQIEAALEFGAQISIDLGVASGGVYVKGGFHFLWDQAKSEVHLDAYIEMGGHLDVLGLVTVSLVFHLALSYEKVENKYTRLYGTATLTVEIDIAFFSCSQDVTVERQFAGSDSDPSFRNFLPNASLWTDDYCGAFAD